MNEKEWREIVDFIQRKLIEIDRKKIADLGNQEKQTGAKGQVDEMLFTLQKELDKEEKSVGKSLNILMNVIQNKEKDCPTIAVVWDDEGSGLELNKDPAIDELRRLRKNLNEITNTPDDPTTELN